MKHYIFILTILLGLTSCEKDADITIDEMPPQLVLSSMLSNSPSESYIKLTMSKGFKRDSYMYEPITDAQVQITDNYGNIIHFQPDTEGVYKTTTPAVPNTTYRLKVQRGDKYLTAENSMLPQVALQDFDFSLEQSQIRRRINLVLFFDDDPTVRNYYRVIIDYSDNGYTYQVVDFLTTDYGYNRQNHSLRIRKVPFNSDGGTYTVKLTHINRETFEYFNTLKNIREMGYGDSPFVSAVPGNPNSNVQGGIGYFAAGTSSAVSKLISITN